MRVLHKYTEILEISISRCTREMCIRDRGYKVVKLDRVFFAGLTKKGLRRGDWRYLSEAEVNYLRMEMCIRDRSAVRIRQRPLPKGKSYEEIRETFFISYLFYTNFLCPFAL